MLSSNWLVAPRLWGALAVAVLAAALCTDRPALAHGSNNTIKSYHLDSHSQRIDVPVVLHKSETVRTDFPFGDAMVGDPEIADVVPLTNQSIYILGKKPGVTRLSLLDAKKQVLGVVDIEVTYDLDLMRRTLLTNPAFSKIKVSSMNGKVLLSGIAPDAPAMQRVVTLAEQLAPHDVTNGMLVASPQQVMLEVRFIEATRDLGAGCGRQLGDGRKSGRHDREWKHCVRRRYGHWRRQFFEQYGFQFGRGPCLEFSTVRFFRGPGFRWPGEGGRDGQRA